MPKNGGEDQEVINQMIKTPFRYPGAKNKLLPMLMDYLNPLLSNSTEFIDVFVGGGSVLLEIAEKYPKMILHANDKDYWMYCFWNIVAGNDSYKLNKLLNLIDTPPTLELFYKLREEKTTDEVESAYRAIFFNRTTFSGIFYSGPIGGKEQKSKYTVDCRYNAKKIKSKINACHNLLKDRTTVYNLDFSQLQSLINSDIVAYLDPPYYDKGDALYIEKMSHSDHQNLSNILFNRKNWVLSYDDCAEIRDFYKNSQIIDLSARYCINGKKDNWEHKNELVIMP